MTNRSLDRENCRPSFSPAVPVQQPVHFVQTSLPKVKWSEFHGNSLQWTECSSLFTAAIHNATFNANAKWVILKHSLKIKPRQLLLGLDTQEWRWVFWLQISDVHNKFLMRRWSIPFWVRSSCRKTQRLLKSIFSCLETIWCHWRSVFRISYLLSWNRMVQMFSSLVSGIMKLPMCRMKWWRNQNTIWRKNVWIDRKGKDFNIRC